MTTAPWETRVIDPLIDRIGREITGLVEAIEARPLVDAACDLEDHQLMAIAAWTKNGAEAITAECKRRAELGRKFAAWLEQPTIGDVLRRVLES